MADQKKCAHPSCNCTVQKEKYCSDYCHDAGGTTELACNCRHPECVGQSVAATTA